MKRVFRSLLAIFRDESEVKEACDENGVISLLKAKGRRKKPDWRDYCTRNDRTPTVATEIRTIDTTTPSTFWAGHSHSHSSDELTTTSLVDPDSWRDRSASFRACKIHLSRILVSAIRARAPHRVAGCHLQRVAARHNAHIYI